MGRTRNHANFATGNNIFVDTTNNRVGVGTTVPSKTLHIYTADGDIRIGDITEGTSSTDAGIIFTGLGTVTSALFTEVDGTILSYGINCGQITGIETGRAGGIFRLDARTSGPYGDASCFVVKGRPIGSTTEYDALVVGLNDGNTYLSPIRGSVLVGTSSSTGTASQRLQVTGGAYISGDVGIGTTNPTSALHVVGNVRVIGVITCTDINSTSDIKLKENIHQIKDPLNKVMQINGVGFRWKDTKEDAIGVIAQDIEEVLPELVKENDHHKSVNYNGLIGVLIEAVKEQQRQILELKAQLNDK